MRPQEQVLDVTLSESATGNKISRYSWNFCAKLLQCCGVLHGAYIFKSATISMQNQDYK